MDCQEHRSRQGFLDDVGKPLTFYSGTTYSNVEHQFVDCLTHPRLKCDYFESIHILKAKEIFLQMK